MKKYVVFAVLILVLVFCRGSASQAQPGAQSQPSQPRIVVRGQLPSDTPKSMTQFYVVAATLPDGKEVCYAVTTITSAGSVATPVSIAISPPVSCKQ